MYQLVRTSSLVGILRTAPSLQQALSPVTPWAPQNGTAFFERTNELGHTRSWDVLGPELCKRSLAVGSGGPLPPWYAELTTPANLVSLARAVSGPVVADLIVREAWPAAVCLLAVSGASDWLDGYLARKHGQSSVLGSYLDPFADKVLIGCAVGAMMYKGMFPVWLGALIVGRDVFLVGASVAKRFQQVGWVWPGADAFFKSQPDAAGPNGKGPGSTVQTAHRVEPLMVSKVNTVFQLLLVASCLSRPLLSWPEAGVVDALTTATAVTTVVSCGAYAVKMARGA